MMKRPGVPWTTLMGQQLGDGSREEGGPTRIAVIALGQEQSQWRPSTKPGSSLWSCGPLRPKVLICKVRNSSPIGHSKGHERAKDRLRSTGP